MSRMIPYDKNAVCDECGHVGAYDFMGDCLCEKCAAKSIPEDIREPQMSTASENELVEKLGSMEWEVYDVPPLTLRKVFTSQQIAILEPLIRDYVNAQVAAAVEECKQRIVGIAKELRVGDRDVAESPYRQDNVEWDCNGNALVAEIQKLYLSTESVTQAAIRRERDEAAEKLADACDHVLAVGNFHDLSDVRYGGKPIKDIVVEALANYRAAKGERK